MKTQYVHLLSIVILTASFLFVGCSVTGWTTKEIPDGCTIDKGEIVSIITRDGNVVTGNYVELQEIPMDEYIELYQRTLSKSSLDQYLPHAGEYILVSTSVAPDKYWEGRFVSFDAGNLRMKSNGKTENVYISGITSLSNSRGKTLQKMHFRQLFESGDITLRSAIVLKSGGNDVKIPINTIEKITAQSNMKITIADELRKRGYTSFTHFID